MKIRISGCIIGISMLLFTSCHLHRQEDNRTVFRYNESAGITSLDPAFAKDQANIWACNQLFNSLVQLDSELHILPCLAQAWDISPDGKTYTFHLRTNVCFHQTDYYRFSGIRHMTAHDVVYSFNRLVHPHTASPGAWVLAAVQRKSDGTLAVSAPNDSTVTIQLSHPFPPFLGLLSMQYCSIIPREVVEKYGKDFRKYPVGTGPFMFKTWKEGVKLIMVKNPDYFETDSLGCHLPYLDAIAVTFIIDKQSAYMEFVKGNLDFMSGLDASYKDELLTRNGELNPVYEKKIHMLSMPYLNTEYLGFLMDKHDPQNPLLIKEVRQAINYGFDRKKMLRFLRSNIGMAGIHGMIPYGMPPYSDSALYGYDYNPQKARELLAKAGYPNGKNMPPVKLYVTENYMDITQYIAHELEQIGINIEMVKIQPAILRQFISKSEINFFRGSWIADYPDAENYLSLFYSDNFCPNGPNYTHYQNATYDRLYQLSQATTNDSIRNCYYRQMDSLMMNDAPVVILYYDKVLRFVSNKIQGMENNSMNLLTLKNVKKNN